MGEGDEGQTGGAPGRVRPSMDKEGSRKGERAAWPYRFKEEERRVLDAALTALKMAEYKADEDAAVKERAAELDRLLMSHQKDFSAIKEISKRIEN